VHALDQDQDQQEDRIVAMYNSEAGWQFGCEEQKKSSEQVQACLNGHEAITYRAPGPEGSSRHEFPAMVAHLVAKLGAAGAAGGDKSREVAAVQPIAGVRDRLAQSEKDGAMLRVQLTAQGKSLAQAEMDAQEAVLTLKEQLAAQDAELKKQLAAKDAELEELRARLCDALSQVVDEGVPPV
jgi:hypothetical protein